MKQQIELDENKVLEVQQTSLQIATKAEQAAIDLEKAAAIKMFGPDGEMVLQEAERHGKEVVRALAWWEDEFIGPVVDSAHNLWKMLCDRRKVISDPLKAKKTRLALAVGAYRQAHERDRREREEKERRRLEKEAEDKRIADALELEKSGKKDEAQELIEAPVYTPPVTFAAPAKSKGVGERGTWKYEIVNRNLVPDQFWAIDTVALGAQVRLNKDQVAIPGVRIYFEPSASFSTR